MIIDSELDHLSPQRRSRGMSSRDVVMVPNRSHYDVDTEFGRHHLSRQSYEYHPYIHGRGMIGPAPAEYDNSMPISRPRPSVTFANTAGRDRREPLYYQGGRHTSLLPYSHTSRTAVTTYTPGEIPPPPGHRFHGAQEAYRNPRHYYQ